MRRDLAYPSSDQREWLSDVIIANAHAADERPEGDVPVRFNYPRPQAQVPQIFRQRPAQRVLHQQQSCLGQQFCDGIHWHNIVLLFNTRLDDTASRRILEENTPDIE